MSHLRPELRLGFRVLAHVAARAGRQDVRYQVRAPARKRSAMVWLQNTDRVAVRATPDVAGHQCSPFGLGEMADRTQQSGASMSGRDPSDRPDAVGVHEPPEPLLFKHPGPVLRIPLPKAPTGRFWVGSAVLPMEFANTIGVAVRPAPVSGPPPLGEVSQAFWRSWDQVRRHLYGVSHSDDHPGMKT